MFSVVLCRVKLRFCCDCLMASEMPGTDRNIYGKEKRGISLQVFRTFRLGLFFFLENNFIYVISGLRNLKGLRVAWI